MLHLALLALLPLLAHVNGVPVPMPLLGLGGDGPLDTLPVLNNNNGGGDLPILNNAGANGGNGVLDTLPILGTGGGDLPLLGSTSPLSGVTGGNGNGGLLSGVTGGNENGGLLSGVSGGNGGLLSGVTGGNDGLLSGVTGGDGGLLSSVTAPLDTTLTSLGLDLSVALGVVLDLELPTNLLCSLVSGSYSSNEYDLGCTCLGDDGGLLLEVGVDAIVNVAGLDAWVKAQVSH